MAYPLSIYLHIPFCRHRCAYCDFNTYTGLDDLQEQYATALAQEVQQVGQAAGIERLPVQTIFLGGGTPSLMPAPAIASLLQSIAQHFDLAEDAEITMEANPGTVDQPYLAQLRSLGLNRLSFGMQSAIPTELALLEREHDLDAVVAAVEMSRKAGFDNLSLDLIYGLPHQSLASWQESLQAALALGTEHLSLYCLTIEEGTPMRRWLQEGRIPVPDPDLAADQYALACETLAQPEWEHYEISNWSRLGKACQHNLTYWRNQEYLGLGAGAHGQAAGYRYEVVKQPRVYVQRLQEETPAHYPLSAAVADAHQVTKEEAMSDTMITQLRLLQEGLDIHAFERRFGQTPQEAYGSTLAQLLEWGLLKEASNRLLLTERGWFLSNQVFYRFM